MILNLLPLFFILIIIPLAYADGEDIVEESDYVSSPAQLDGAIESQLKHKLKILSETIQKYKTETSWEETKKIYPATSLNIDEQRAAVKIGLDPVYFTDELIPHHFTWIREILGDEINIVLVSQEAGVWLND